MHNAPDSLKEGYEVSDMNVGVIVIFLVGLFILLFGAVAAILMVQRGFEESRVSLNTETASALATPDLQVPTKPHLQQRPVADRLAIQQANAAQVNGYGIVSEDHGMERVHIPVARAMQLVAEGKAYRQTPMAAQLPSSEQ